MRIVHAAATFLRGNEKGAVLNLLGLSKWILAKFRDTEGVFPLVESSSKLFITGRFWDINLTWAFFYWQKKTVVEEAMGNQELGVFTHDLAKF